MQTFRCPSANGLFVHPESCTSFYMCSNGLSYSYVRYKNELNMIFKNILIKTFDFNLKACPVDVDGRKLSFNPVIGVCDKTSSSCSNQGNIYVIN